LIETDVLKPNPHPTEDLMVKILFRAKSPVTLAGFPTMSSFFVASAPFKHYYE